MEEQYAFNPFVFISEQAGNYVLTNGLDYEKILSQKKYSGFVDEVVNQKTFSLKTLEKWFTQNEIIELFNKKIFIDNPIDLEENNSRNRGYFLYSHNELYYDNLSKKEVFVLGAGAIGCHVAWSLAAIGLKRITVLDFDIIDATNLNRQVLYTLNDKGRRKVDVLKEQLESRFARMSIIWTQFDRGNHVLGD